RNPPFDLAQPPLWRALLIHVAAQEHIFVYIVHHSIMDGWSNGIFRRELSHFYNGFTTGIEPPSLPALPVSYQDFSIWQRTQIQDARLAELVSYWRFRLANIQPLNLPTDRPRRQQPSHQGKIATIAIDHNVYRGLADLARRQDASLYMVLLTAFQILLHRYSHQDDIAVGSPIANRTRPELEGIYGFFANTLVMRTDCSGNPTVIALLAQVCQHLLDAYQHQDLPFEKLVEELMPVRQLHRTPFFDVLFSLQNFHRDTWTFQGITTQAFVKQDIISKFDMNIVLHETKTGLSGRWEYATDLFDDATIKRMITHFEMLLRGIVTNPSQPIAQIPLLTDSEITQIQLDWNDTSITYDALCVHQLFERQAKATPDAVAVVYQQDALTYAELDTRANQLADHLQSLGVGPDVLVGICVERSLAMIIGLLAVLKAGGAYVPLDPMYPQRRLTFMLQDTDSPVLLTQTTLTPLFQSYTGHLLQLDDGMSFLNQKRLANPPSTTTLDHLVYITYTSGSTGVPKGIAMPHQAMTNFIQWQLNHTALRHKTTPINCLQYSSLNFDASFTDIFMTLCAGDTLFIIPESARQDPEQLVQFVAQHEIVRANFPAVVLQQFAEFATQKAYAFKLREVLSTAEQLQITPAIVNLFESLDGAVLQNQYGPAETHVVASLKLLEMPSTWPQFPSIGWPIANTQLYILDAHMQSVPIGVTGDLYIGGHSLARAYINRSELTEEKFIPHPCCHEEGKRLYRTGDLAYYLPDGRIQFLGRKDNQVKIRGFSVELGEVEAALYAHAAVSQAAVLVREIQDEKQLVAYLVLNPSTEHPVTVSELRRFLAEIIPEYMQPSAYVYLDALPLTPNGKLDRHALPAPDRYRPALLNAFVPPQSATETALAAIWGNLLNLNRVGLHDHFFELGGHSLLAVRTASQIRNHFTIELPLRILFERTTIHELGYYIDALLLAKRINPATNRTVRNDTQDNFSNLEEEEW
ncbi:MAG: amino acid adenylation domain-containing protein, partial [Chloroflexota bacterium]